MLSVTYASCSPWRTSTIRSPGSANAARSSSAKWSSTKTRLGSATSGAPKEFSSGLPKSSGSRLPDEHMGRYRPEEDQESLHGAMPDALVAIDERVALNQGQTQ